MQFERRTVASLGAARCATSDPTTIGPFGTIVCFCAVQLAGNAVIEFQLPGSLTIVAGVLFIRGMGTCAVGIPSISAAYASAQREDPPMAGSESVKPFVLWPFQRLTPNP